MAKCWKNTYKINVGILFGLSLFRKNPSIKTHFWQRDHEVGVRPSYFTIDIWETHCDNPNPFYRDKQNTLLQSDGAGSFFSLGFSVILLMPLICNWRRCVGNGRSAIPASASLRTPSMTLFPQNVTSQWKLSSAGNVSMGMGTPGQALNGVTNCKNV